MADKPKYSIGRLRNPRPEDPRFEHRGEAIATAFEKAKNLDHVWAMWLGDNIAAVFYDGQMFT